MKASDEQIINDYTRTNKEMPKAVAIGEIQKRRRMDGIKMENFAGSPPEAMEHTLRHLRAEYGSVESYLDSIGFDNEWRNMLRSRLRVGA
ncbi:hypothetical protein CYMTET_42495 [Cymbomonas tetramitiformis]|uniref:Uncharacterized protein n=1 Tax=Cymbomonas tetramitiformis TaxID=36881 RepID=A0AAE0C440_9CHLO|nr:hypothetical protein CYMTET_42495 [Cymbomonas tetramitiformis]